MNKILVQFLSKSFSKLAPNATVTTNMIAHVIQTAADGIKAMQLKENMIVLVVKRGAAYNLDVIHFA